MIRALDAVCNRTYLDDLFWKQQVSELKVANWQLCHSAGRILDLKFANYRHLWKSEKLDSRYFEHPSRSVVGYLT